MTDSEARYRLPRTCVPMRYDLVIEPDLASSSFVGREDVALRVNEPITEIVLNALELDISSASLTDAHGKVEVGKIRLDPDTERVHLDLASTTGPGEWTLHIEFSGEINDKLVGFYRSTYERDGTHEVVATTHFEATDARRAFPCWDEPDLKAVWGITLVVAADLTALSNGPEAEREALVDGRVRIRFADTIPMSSYLVAYVVGHLELTDPLDVDGVPTRIAHVPGKGGLAVFSLEVGAAALRFFSDYYGIPYPDAKVDHIGLPDFAQGAMENLGCITYREASLLVDPASSTHQEQLDIAETVAHELAHMWFGDLVTMRWWNGLWLNEAFATFMANLAVDAYRPDWEVWSTFARMRTMALEVDALESTRPIEYPVYSPDDAQGMFDTLTYLKGGAILRMLERYLGGDRFRDGIRRYLRKHAHANAETHDLWDALEEETGEPVRRIMDSWIFQGGYPAITVAAKGDTLMFSQRRYVPSKSDDPSKWVVPLFVRQVAPDGRTTTDKILVEPGGTALAMLASDAVVVANAGAVSFVRVWYEQTLGARHSGAALAGLSSFERYTLVDDAWAAVTAGTSTASSFCRFVAGYVNEDDLSVWQLILSGLGWCDRFVEGEAREHFRDFVRDLVKPTLARLTWDSDPTEPDLTRALRGTLVQALGVLADDPEAKAQAREVEAEARDGGDVDPHLASAAAQIVAHDGNQEDYARFWAVVRDGVTPQEQLRYLFALASFGSAELMDRTLAACLTEDVRPQDAPFLIARATINRDQGERVWRFLAEHWSEEISRFADSNIISLVSGVRFLSTPALRDDAAAFFTEHHVPQAGLMLEQILERQRVAVALRERATPDLSRAFA